MFVWILWSSCPSSEPTLRVTRPSWTKNNKQTKCQEGLIFQGYLINIFFFKIRLEDFRSGWKLVWMFIFLIVSGKKGWVIQTSASASGLGLGSVFTLIFAPQGTCVSLGGGCPCHLPHLLLSFPKRSPRGVRDLNSV